MSEEIVEEPNMTDSQLMRSVDEWLPTDDAALVFHAGRVIPEKNTMKRGFTKPFSGGQLGEEQRRDANRIKSIRYHSKMGDKDVAARLFKKLTPELTPLQQLFQKVRNRNRGKK